jgi:hypothetical protein
MWCVSVEVVHLLRVRFLLLPSRSETRACDRLLLRMLRQQQLLQRRLPYVAMTAMTACSLRLLGARP